MSLTFWLAAIQLPAQAGPELTSKKACRRETVTGSNLRKRTCHTEAEWQMIDQQFSDQMKVYARDSNMRGNARGRPPGP